MSRFLQGMTHALLTVPTKEEMTASGIRASVSICFGPGDENAITNINYVREDGLTFWKVPHIELFQNGQRVQVPVFRGELFEKLCHVAARAQERVKQVIGTPEWGTSYRIFGSPDGSPKVEIVA